MAMEENEESIGENSSSGSSSSSSSSSRCEMVFGELKPHMLSVLACFCQAGSNIISKASLDKGMSRYVLVVYGHVFGTLATALLALLLERNNESKLSVPVLRNIFFLSLLRVVLARTLMYAGLELTTSTFTTAMLNLVPSFTFILAIIFRMEKLKISKVSSQAKIGGTLVTFVGATLMTLYKGIVVIWPLTQHSHQTTTSESLSDRNWMKGSILLVISCLANAAFFILQAATIKKYPAPFSLTSLTCLVGTLMATIMTVILDHETSSWRLSWNIKLIAPIYNGILTVGIASYVQTLVIQIKGPVFTTAYKPLSTLIVAIMGLLISRDAFYLGGIVGAVLIILGLYLILWGKGKEKKKKPVQGAIHDQGVEVKLDK